MIGNPLVSIIIPVYNESSHLADCLDSLKKQTYQNTEIIVVDDGSTDNSITIAKKFDVIIFQQKHTGPGFARNYGVYHSKGSIVVFADADMRFDKKYIEKLIKPILMGGAIGTFTKEEYVANPENLWSQCWSINSGLPVTRRLPENYKDTENAFRAIKKDYFIKGKGFAIHEGYTDDSSLSSKLKIEAHSAPGAICYHYNPSSLKDVFFSARWIGRSRLFQPDILNFLRFTPVNSFRICIKYILRGAPFAIIPFKLTFDCGMFVGIFFRYGKTAK